MRPLLILVLLFSLSRGQFHGILKIRDRILSAFGRDSQNSLENAIESAIKEAKSRLLVSRDSYRVPDNFLQEPLVTYGKMMTAGEGAAKVAEQSEVLLRATEILVDRFGLEVLEELREIDVSKWISFPSSPKSCDPFSKYRSYDGSCNNLNNPTFGTAFYPLKRLLQSKYEDGVSIPRSLSVTGGSLPSPRFISNQIHQYNSARSSKFSLMLMQFGQLVDHEITHAPVAQTDFGGNLNCSRCDSPQSVSCHCLPIPVPLDDPRFSGCLPFVRTLNGQRTLGSKEQMNQITSFLDGSAFYGSSKKASDTLRTFKGGKLHSTAGGNHLGMLLPVADDQGECKSSPQFPCFSSGDSRNSQQSMIQALHVIFHRHHNSLANGLERRRPDWDDEVIFQETRKIVAAQFAHIVYTEFLPKIIGQGAMTKYNLNQEITGIDHSQDYDPTCDASISQPFAAAAFRFGHSLVARLYPLLNGELRNISAPMDLTENFNNVQQIYNERAGGVDSLLMGLIASSSMSFDPHVSTVLRNHLFAQRGKPGSGMDLAAINIQRGRDHGVGSYNDHREYCGHHRAHDFSALLSDMDFEMVGALEKTYAHVDDIDLFTGLLAERAEHDALVGPITTCLLGEQFLRLKKCDRYFYDLRGPGEFTAEQLAEIRKTTLAGIICDNSRLPQLPPDVFTLPDGFMNSLVACENLPQLDLNPWV